MVFMVGFLLAVALATLLLLLLLLFAIEVGFFIDEGGTMEGGPMTARVGVAKGVALVVGLKVEFIGELSGLRAAIGEAMGFEA
jgi:hypothetical protein